MGKKFKKRPSKLDHIQVDGWNDKIKAIADEMVRSIAVTLNKYIIGESIEPIHNCFDRYGDRIERIYILGDEEVFIDTLEFPQALLNDEPINVILQIIDVINKEIFNMN